MLDIDPGFGLAYYISDLTKKSKVFLIK